MSRLVQTGECAHCNLSLSSNLRTPCLTCCPLPLFLSPHPAVPFSSLYHHFTSSPPSTPSPFSLCLTLFLLSHSAHEVNQQHLGLISLAPPSGFLTHSIYMMKLDALLSWLMNHWIITVCGNVCEPLWVCTVSTSTEACVSICVFLPFLWIIWAWCEVFWDSTTGSIPAL